MTDIVERLTGALPSSADIWEAKREIESLRLRVAELEVVIKDFAQIEHGMEQQLAECQAKNAKLAERVVGVGEIAINSVSRQALAECQADNKRLRDALKKIAAVDPGNQFSCQSGMAKELE